MIAIETAEPRIGAVARFPAGDVGFGAQARTKADEPPRLDYRWLSPRQLVGYGRLLRRMPAPDRLARFHGSVGDATLDAHVAGLRWPANRVLGAFEDAWLLGAAELALFAGAGGQAEAELSLTVDQPQQGQGIGTTLVERSLLWARNRWVRRVSMMTKLGNRRLRAIGRRLGAGATIDGDDVHLAFELTAPDYGSMLVEALDVMHGMTRPGSWRHLLPAFVDGGPG